MLRGGEGDDEEGKGERLEWIVRRGWRSCGRIARWKVADNRIVVKERTEGEEVIQQGNNVETQRSVEKSRQTIKVTTARDQTRDQRQETERDNSSSRGGGVARTGWVWFSSMGSNTVV